MSFYEYVKWLGCGPFPIVFACQNIKLYILNMFSEAMKIVSFMLQYFMKISELSEGGNPAIAT